jgi:hypothetical protein
MYYVESQLTFRRNVSPPSYNRSFSLCVIIRGMGGLMGLDELVSE